MDSDLPWSCSSCTFANNCLLSSCEVCEASRAPLESLPAELEQTAALLAGHLQRGSFPSPYPSAQTPPCIAYISGLITAAGISGGDCIFLLHHLLAQLEPIGIIVNEFHLAQFLEGSSASRHAIESPNAISAAFFQRIWGLLSGPRSAESKLGFDNSVLSLLQSGEACLMANAITETQARFWPIVTEFSMPYLAQKEW
jgi:hypothetical protein